ncbi:uncharacterized protein [Temnothorax nylanderi]|uniref:uncharacterized protein n=1 Tax=Temnothorax nylanderi TaxID=102681 RepID=UPI003A87335D
MQVQEDNSKADKAETSQTIVPIIVSDVEITQPSTSTIKKPAVRNKSSDDSPRKRKLREKFQKLKAQNKVMRETIRRLCMKKKKEATKVEEENEFDQLKKLGLLTCLKDEYTNEKLGEEVELINITFYRFLVYILSIFCSTLLYSNCSLHFYCPFLFLGCIEVDRVAEIQINERIVQ